MNQSLKVAKFVSEVIKLLDPHQNFKSLVKFYHNSVLVEGKKINLQGKIHLVGVGKAASFEVDAFLKLLQESEVENPIGQIVSLTKEDFTVPNKAITQLEGTHPVISETNIEITKKLIELLKNIKEQDTLIFLLSGGGSALLELPNEGMSFKDLQDCHKELLNSGKSINEMNEKRKELSQVKNGKLLNFIPTRSIIQFITCDIPNGKLADVSSGPLLAEGEVTNIETIKSQSAEKLIAKLLNVHPNMVQGEIYNCSLTEMLADLMEKLPTADEILISGGEATFQVSPAATGMGGRNTHFVLAMARELYKVPENRDIHILSLGSDGADGPTDAAGAYINYELFKESEAEEFFTNFDSYHYFEKLGTLIKTGPTKTNIMDLRFMWRE